MRDWHFFVTKQKTESREPGTARHGTAPQKFRKSNTTGLKTCENAHDLILTYLVADINMYND